MSQHKADPFETLTVKPLGVIEVGRDGDHRAGDRLIMRYDHCYYTDAEAEDIRSALEARLGVPVAALPKNIGVVAVEAPSVGVGVES